MKLEVDFTDFTAGELSPRLFGRTDLQKYFDGAATLLNMVPMPQGGVTRRPGFAQVATAMSQATPCRLWPFIFSTVQAYVLEFTAGQMRVYMNDGLVLNGAAQVILTGLPYTNADLVDLYFTQSADTLYVCHPNYPAATITRSSHTSWSYQTITVKDGPYLPVNGTTTTLSVSARSGNITVTASSIVGINATPQSTGQGFLSTDVGRPLRIRLLGAWAWCIITAVTSTTVVSATVQPTVNTGAWGALDGAAWAASTNYPVGIVVVNGGNYYQCIVAGLSAASGGPTGTTLGATVVDNTANWKYIANLPTTTTLWRLGKWGPSTGYPYAVTFWQQRLMFAGNNLQPSALDLSVTGDFTNFAPTEQDGTVVDSNALSWVISDDQVNAVRWVSAAGSAQAMQLGIGTSGSEHILQAATTAAALTPTSVQAYRETTLGSSSTALPQRIGKQVLFANRTGRKLHEWKFQWQVNGYLGPDLAVDAEHITRSRPSTLQGITQMVYQQSPHSILWMIRGDGQLIGMTYLPDQNVVAWHHHQLGGQYYGGPPIVESLAVIPSPDGTYDELWISVCRTIGGVVTRTVEVMTRWFDGMAAEQAFFVDCGLQSTLATPAAILTPAAAAVTTQAANVTMTASAGVFSAASVGSIIRVNDGSFLVTAYTSPTVVTCLCLRGAMSAAPAASGAWSCTPTYQTFGGLSVLAGETVQVLGDGADLGTQVVPVGGSITVSEAASLAAIGLPYTSEVMTMPFEPSHAAGQVIEDQLKTISTLYLRLFESLGCTYGVQEVDPQTYAVKSQAWQLLTRSAADFLGQAPALFSGVARVKTGGGFDRSCQIAISTSGPMPLTVLAIGAVADVGEGAQP